MCIKKGILYIITFILNKGKQSGFTLANSLSIFSVVTKFYQTHYFLWYQQVFSLNLWFHWRPVVCEVAAGAFTSADAAMISIINSVVAWPQNAPPFVTHQAFKLISVLFPLLDIESCASPQWPFLRMSCWQSCKNLWQTPDAKTWRSHLVHRLRNLTKHLFLS